MRVVVAGDALLAPSVTRRVIEEYARHAARHEVVFAYESGLVEPGRS